MPRFASLIGAALILGTASVGAAEPAHDAAAERFLELTHADRLAVPVYAQVQQLFAQRFAEAGSPGGKQATLERYQAQANAALDKAIGWEHLEPELVALYTEAFSEGELEELIAFYRSPLGVKMLERLPTLNARSAQLTQARLQQAAPDVNRLLDELSGELQPKTP